MHGTAFPLPRSSKMFSPNVSMAELRDLDPKDKGRESTETLEPGKGSGQNSSQSCRKTDHMFLEQPRPDFIPSNGKEVWECRKSEEEKFRAYLQTDFHCDTLGVMKTWLRP